MTQIYANARSFFDTDSSFWVCSNSATGHICNDNSLFSGELIPAVYIVGAATGTSEPTLMGTVALRLVTEDNGLHSPIAANNGHLLRISLVFKMRSIAQLLLPTVPKIFGICQHQSILTKVDYVALQGLKF
jgi:hypothetical protein